MISFKEKLLLLNKKKTKKAKMVQHKVHKVASSVNNKITKTKIKFKLVNPQKIQKFKKTN